MPTKTATAWATCNHFETVAGVCGKIAAARYLGGPRCPDHTPAALAGRAVVRPDPARTMEGLRLAAEKVVRDRAEAAERRSRGLRVFRRASGPGGRYTAADIDMAKVHRVERECADLINARRAAR